MKRLWAIPSIFLGFYSAHELPGLFLFILLEESGIPLLLPGDALIAASARKSAGLGSAILVILVAAAAASAGSSILYAIVRRGGMPLLDRYGHFLHLNEKRIAKMEGWLQEHGAVAIIAGRLIPGLRMPTSVIAGLFAIPYRIFLPATALAAILWSAMYFIGGLFLMREWAAIVSAVTDIDDATAPIAGIFVLFVIAGSVIAWRRTARRTTGSRKDPDKTRAA